jgi:hypothetical protein
MRTLDATLQAALATYHFVPYFKLKVYRNGALISTLDVLKYKLTGTHLSVTTRGLISISTSPDYINIVLERGIVSNGTAYVLDSSKFTPISGHAERLSSKSLYVSTTIEADLVSPKAVSFDGSTSYQTVITSFCTAIGKTPVFKDPGAAYWASQFMPNGTTITLNDARMFLSLLQEKRLIFACDNGGEAILFYCALDIPGAYDASINPVLYNLGTGYFARRRFMATDENGIVTYAGTVGDILFNLGYKYDADPFPSVYSQAQPLDFTLPINLQYQDGDKFGIDGNSYSMYPALVTEIFDPKASPGWQVNVKQLQYFSETEGGALPSGLAIKSPFMPVNTSMFDHILDASCNNTQTCFDKLDDHTHPSGGYTQGARVYRSTSQAIGAGTYVAVSFDTERYDTDANWTIGVPTELICKTAGVYIITAHVTFAAQTAGLKHFYIRLNGATIIAEQSSMTITTAGVPMEMSISTVWKLAINDYVELVVWETSAGTIAASPDFSPEFAMQRIG